MNHSGTKSLESSRLLLRRFKINDALPMYSNWASDQDVAKFVTWEVHQNSETTKKIIEEWINNYSKNNYYKWAIVLKENGDDPIGDISVVKNDEKNFVLTIGYCLGKKWWNKGIMTEAVKLVIDYLFKVVQVHEVRAEHIVENTASGVVMKKAGMLYEKTVYDVGRKGKPVINLCCYFIKNPKFKNQ